MANKPKEMKPMKLATLCYVEKDNQYLMLHRNKKSRDMHKGLWVGLLKQSDEGDLAWVDKDKLDELPMHKADPCFIKLLQEDKGIFSAKYVYVSGVLKDYRVNFYR